MTAPTNAALIESAVGTSGYGASSAGSGGAGRTPMTQGQMMMLGKMLQDSLSQYKTPQLSQGAQVQRQAEYVPGGQWFNQHNRG